MTRGGEDLERSDFRIAKMDCASEERIVRMAVESVQGVSRLDFDLPNRGLAVWHTKGLAPELDARLQALSLGASRLVTQPSTPGAHPPGVDRGDHAATLWTVLVINAGMFVVELAAGLWFRSAGLVADSFDMFADAAVYGLSLYAVGRPVRHQLRAAHVSGFVQLGLAAYAALEVVRRFVSDAGPEPVGMMGVAAVALLANITCLVLVSRQRDAGAHMKASYIFSTNDVLANIGVIAAGGLVGWTGSRVPDLLAGAAIAVLVLIGALRILRLRA